MPLPRVKLNIAADRRENLVEIDGHDLTAGVMAVQIGVVASETPTLAHVTLHLKANLELNAELAEVISVGQSDGPDLVAFLNQIDPGELEQAALSRLGGLDGGPANVGQAVVEVLKEWAKD